MHAPWYVLGMMLRRMRRVPEAALGGVAGAARRRGLPNCYDAVTPTRGTYRAAPRSRWGYTPWVDPSSAREPRHWGTERSGDRSSGAGFRNPRFRLLLRPGPPKARWAELHRCRTWQATSLRGPL
jgi:hypothetical protein